MRLKLTTKDGKYTIIQDESGVVSILRYGEKWKDNVHDSVILALAYELYELREAIRAEYER